MILRQLTIQSQLVEVLVPEVLWVAAELGVPLPGGDLEVVVADPPGHPAHLAVAGEEAAAEAEAAQGAVEVAEGVLGERGHGVSVEGEEREVRHAVEGRRRQHAQQVETQVKHLQNQSEWLDEHP